MTLTEQAVGLQQRRPGSCLWNPNPGVGPTMWFPKARLCLGMRINVHQLLVSNTEGSAPVRREKQALPGAYKHIILQQPPLA